MNLKKLGVLLIAAGLIVGITKGIDVYAHGGNNNGNIQNYEQGYIVDANHGVASSGWVTKKHNTSAINNVTSIGGNKAIYSYVRYLDSNKNMVKVSEERSLKGGQRTQLKYSNPANWYYGHSMDMKFRSGSTVWVDVRVNGSWSPDDNRSTCTM